MRIWFWIFIVSKIIYICSFFLFCQFFIKNAFQFFKYKLSFFHSQIAVLYFFVSETQSNFSLWILFNWKNWARIHRHDARKLCRVSLEYFFILIDQVLKWFFVRHPWSTRLIFPFNKILFLFAIAFFVDDANGYSLITMHLSQKIKL